MYERGVWAERDHRGIHGSRKPLAILGDENISMNLEE
jgi:hypothetical protein